MRLKWPVLAALLGFGACYVAYPYVTLYRIGVALHSADAASLQGLVDWSSVREGIKEDICDYVVEPPADHTQLPAFGASFVRGIAGNAIDRAVTPDALLAAVHTKTAEAKPMISGADVTVQWAFFETPTQFNVSLAAPGQDEPIRLELRMRDAQWQVTRVWLPPSLLQRANART